MKIVNSRTIFVVAIALLLQLAPRGEAAFGSVGSLITAQQKGSSSSWSPTTSAQLDSGNLGVLVIAVDNSDTANDNTNLCSSVGDAAGNSWIKAREFTNARGSSDAGATVCVFYTKASANLSSGAAITITLAAAKAAKAVTGWEFTMSAANTISVEDGSDLANDGADAGSMTLPSLANREHLYIRGGAVESNATSYTASSNYTAFTHSSSTTSGAASASNMGARAEFRILSGTGDSTNPTTASVDQASVYVAINEDPAPEGGGPRRIFISEQDGWELATIADRIEQEK
jgi:hypothetical protein